MKTLGLYIHIPFCRSKCLYCDFCSLPNPEKTKMQAYGEALCRDLQARTQDAAAYTVDTVYVGGGTPTVLPIETLTEILRTVHRCYRVSPDAEITAECNPKTGDADYFYAMRRAGFNRLSIGLQSAHKAELRALGRIHSFSDFEDTVADARRAGFENISADVMSGIPNQTPQSYSQTLERLIALAPSHISAYGLTVEEDTPFGRMGERLVLPDEEAARQMYFEGALLLEAAGYRQYEISNFARAGYESRHNLKYWNCEEYLGFGVAAYSDFGGARFGNGRSVDAYIKGENVEIEREYPSENDRINEYVMLRMRLREGVREDTFRRRFGRSFLPLFGAQLSAYEKSGLVCLDDGGAALTREGMYVSNAILSEILNFDNQKN